MREKYWIKGFFKHFDCFGVKFNFRYKMKNKYYSATSGVACLLFFIFSLIYISFNFPSFIKREKFVVNKAIRTINMKDKIFFKKFLDTIDVKVKCNKNEDFFLVKKEYLTMKINTLYSDEYYKISIIFQEQQSQNSQYNNLTDIFQENDCKVLFSFNNTVRNITNFDDPYFTYTAEDVFYLSSYFRTEVNFFFRIEGVYSFTNILFDSKNSNTEYVNYVTNEKQYFEPRSDNYNIIATINVFQIITKKIIERRFLKLNEFISDMFSFLSFIFIFLLAIFSSFNSIFAYHSIMRKLFQVKDDSKNIEGKDEMKVMYRTIRVTSKVKTTRSILGYSRNCAKLSERKVGFNINEKNSITNLKKNNDDSKSKSSFVSNNNDISEQSSVIHYKQRKSKLSAQVFPTVSSSINGSPNIQFNSPKISLRKTASRQKSFKYTPVEFIFVFLFPCIKWGILKTKSLILKQVENKLWVKLDIFSYLKNIQFNELLCGILFDKNESIVLNFLSKPCISFCNRIDVNDKFHTVNDLNINEVNEFFSALNFFSTKVNRTLNEEKLCEIVNIELGDLMKSCESN